MELNVKDLSALELIEALDAYPQDKNPEEHHAIRSEIELRKEVSQRVKSEKEGHTGHPGQNFIKSWPKKKLVFRLISLALICLFTAQYVFAGRPIHVVLVFVGLVVNSYIFHVLVIDNQLNKPEVVDRIANTTTLKEAMKILKGPLYLRVAEWLVFLVLGAVYVLYS